MRQKRKKKRGKTLNYHYQPHSPAIFLQERNVFDVITSPFHILKGFVLFFSEFKKRENKKEHKEEGRRHTHPPIHTLFITQKHSLTHKSGNK